LAFLFLLILEATYVIYRFIRIVFNNGKIDALQLAILIVVVLLKIAFIVISVGLFKSFDKWRFRKLVASLQSDPDLRASFKWYEIWITLLKLDIMFGIDFILMGLFFFFSTTETIFNFIGLFIAFTWAIMGNIGVRLEDKRVMCAFFIFSFIAPLYYIYKLVQFITESQYSSSPLPQIYLAATLALLVRCLLLASTIKMWDNFGRGLKERVFDPEEEEEPVINQIADKEVKPYLTLTIKKFKQSLPASMRGKSKEELPQSME